MGYQAHGTTALCQRGKNLDHLIQRARAILGVEAPEAFIDKNCVHPDLARKALDHISEPKREGQCRDKGLAA